MSPETYQKRYSFQKPSKQDDIGEGISINLIAQIPKFLSIKRAIEPSKLQQSTTIQVGIGGDNQQRQSAMENRQRQAKTKS